MKLILVLLILLLSSCSRATLKDPKALFRIDSGPMELRDSYSLESFREALEKTLVAYDSNDSRVAKEFFFGDRVITREEYRAALTAILPELSSWERFHEFIRKNFLFYSVYGQDRWGDIFSTGYYDVILSGSKTPTDVFSEPLYRTPRDLVSVDLSAYAERKQDLKPLQDLVREERVKPVSWRGRLVEGGKIPKVLPYYDRAEIQRARPLADKGLEIAWVRPLDAFFLEIQGSGTVRLPDNKEIRVGYDSQNGYSYAAIGKFLTDVIPIEQMSMQRIRAHLETLPRDRLQDVLDKNPSYVFFQELKGQSLTYSGAEVTAARTIATDQVLYPKGTLAFLDIELPTFASPEELDPQAWEKKPRWVFDQDTGGAIRGGGRVDLFMGSGTEAERMAGVMKRHGNLWVLAPTPEFLQALGRP